MSTYRRHRTGLDPNEYYKPEGGVGPPPQYEEYRYNGLRRPLYSNLGKFVSGDVTFSVTTKYSFNAEYIPSILKIPRVSFRQHLTQEFSAPRPDFRRPAPPGKPNVVFQKPQRSAFYGFIFPWVYDAYFKGEVRAAEEAFERRPEVVSYKRALALYQSTSEGLERKYEQLIDEWKARGDEFNSQRDAEIVRLSAIFQSTKKGDEQAAAEVCKLVCNAVPYPILFPRIVEFYEQKSVQTKSKSSWLKTVPVTKKDQLYWYDYLIYAVVVRTIFDISTEAVLDPYEMIAVNVISSYKSPTTGRDTTAIIASVVVSTGEAKTIDPVHLNPIDTFRSWKGIAAKILSEMVPVQPVVVFDKSDRRLVEGRDVLSQSTDAQNLAMIDWQDFEHLVRQLFELEFKSTGAEVRVTRSSRDRGVDAVIFDPDPIKGGKTVIQAKRYTNTVDVSSVRDLYGTVQNEGANRGILVTTSHFGADSREFARGKPLTLLDGGNLLALLQKHHFNFRIDLSEAKKAREGET
jgi:restriction system protein